MDQIQLDLRIYYRIKFTIMVQFYIIVYGPACPTSTFLHKTDILLQILYAKYVPFLKSYFASIPIIRSRSFTSSSLIYYTVNTIKCEGLGQLFPFFQLAYALLL